LADFGNYFNRFRVLENRVLRRAPGPKEKKYEGRKTA
jgi:hypothetical protein